MAVSPTLNLASPKTKHEADVMALKLFCLLSFLLVGLITWGTPASRQTDARKFTSETLYI
jgi:hypothetical protein